MSKTCNMRGMRTGQKIKHYRGIKGWSQQDLANALNISYQSVQQWESTTSQAGPKRTRLPAVAKVLGIAVPDLFPGPLNQETVSLPPDLNVDANLLEKIIFEVEAEMPELSSKEKAKAIKIMYMFTSADKAQD